MGSGQAYGGGANDDTEGYGVVTGGDTPRIPGEGTGETVGNDAGMEEWDTGMPAGGGEEGAAAAGAGRPDVTQGGTQNATIESCVQSCNLFLFMGLQSEPANLYPYGACMSTCASRE
jgi:hypothetical protein